MSELSTAKPLDPRPAERFLELREQIHRRIVGQDRAVELMLLTGLAGGHALFEGVPGLGKTLLVRTLAEATHLDFERIQFTPDLMPSDITGAELLHRDPETGNPLLRFVAGPLFAHLVLADEINRTPPRTQAALLQAMQEGEVTVAGETRPLPRPFVVFATQNPIEHEGTYKLPEAQLDRFLFKIRVDYPPVEDEVAIVERTTGPDLAEISPVVGPEEMLAMGRELRELPVATTVARFAVDLVRSTRPELNESVRATLRFGAGPRAAQHLVLAAKARAYLAGRPVPSRDDVAELAEAVLAHRLGLSYAARAEGLEAEDVIRDLVRAAVQEA
jgi:MoxR-like ATPase